MDRGQLVRCSHTVRVGGGDCACKRAVILHNHTHFISIHPSAGQHGTFFVSAPKCPDTACVISHNCTYSANLGALNVSKLCFRTRHGHRNLGIGGLGMLCESKEKTRKSASKTSIKMHTGPLELIPVMLD